MPALDAVLFVAARNSEVDVVQSVGRVMRTFHKGASDEKKYGYIIVPVVVPADVEPEKAMEDNERFSVVWKILNALRAHDDEFNATVNKIHLNKVKLPRWLSPGYRKARVGCTGRIGCPIRRINRRGRPS